ncbi:MAG: acetyl-CoA carboxylase biotin carboxyl carrier protein subunit [Bacteroidales bacterium]|nr:acetyl-CoA carboxylase biotin carboxyl carrier protein subunit [Bacteroidales bacterium]
MESNDVNGNGYEGENGDKKVRCKSLVIDGTKYMTMYNKKFENRKDYVPPDPKKIFSFIPGTIVKLYVKEGQEVKPGDNMLILEAMKMKNRVVFHKEATIKSILVKEGETIPKNYLMVELQ